MHEFSICRALVDAIVAEMKRVEAPRPFRLVEARVVVGSMRQIVPDILQTAYKIMTKDTPAAGSSLRIIKAPTIVKCGKCGWTGEIEGVFFRCRNCGDTAVELTGGMELYLDNLKIESDEQS